MPRKDIKKNIHILNFCGKMRKCAVVQPKDRSVPVFIFLFSWLWGTSPAAIGEWALGNSVCGD